MTTTKATGGLVTYSTPSPFGPGALSLTTRLLANRVSSVMPADYTLRSLPNYSEPVGELTLYQLPDGSGVRITVVPTFPTNYAYAYFVLRGRYEYKSNVTDSQVVVLHSDSSLSPVEYTFLDTDIEPTAENTFYYYSVIALVGGSDGTPLRFEYNPLTGFASAYRYKTYGGADFLEAKLPAFWFAEEPDTLRGVLSVLGGIYDTLRSDIETYMFSSQSAANIEESHISSLASVIGWEVDRSAPASRQRKELPVATALYRRKGRDSSIEYLVQAITGWDVSFDYGYRHLHGFTGDDRLAVFNPTDVRRLSLIGFPEKHALEESVGYSDGTASQVFALTNTYARDASIVTVDITTLEETGWLQVDDFTTSGPTDTHFTLSRDGVGGQTVTFGDGVNGAIPPDAEEVLVTYFYGGDEYLYVPSASGWRSSVGTRIVFEETPASKPITPDLARRVYSIVDKFKASYALYNFVILPVAVLESAPGPADSFSDTTRSFTRLRYDTQDHVFDSATYIRT